MNLGQLLPEISALARAAGRKILDIYETDFEVERKADCSPLTEADMAAHHCIVDGLNALDPTIPVLSEESRAVPYSERRTWQRYWLVDPLDGTREFVKRNGEFTVNIALIDQHQPVLGVVYRPVGGYLAEAARGCGAHQTEPGGPRTAMRAQRPEGAPLVVAGSRSHAGERLGAFLDRLGEHQLISMGSSLKFCLVAAGAADVYLRFGPTSEWDSAAAQCIVEEAGGRVTDTGLAALRYNTRDSLLNPDFLAYGPRPLPWAKLLA